MPLHYSAVWDFQTSEACGNWAWRVHSGTLSSGNHLASAYARIVSGYEFSNEDKVAQYR